MKYANIINESITKYLVPHVNNKDKFENTDDVSVQQQWLCFEKIVSARVAKPRYTGRQTRLLGNLQSEIPKLFNFPARPRVYWEEKMSNNTNSSLKKVNILVYDRKENHASTLCIGKNDILSTLPGKSLA